MQLVSKKVENMTADCSCKDKLKIEGNGIDGTVGRGDMRSHRYSGEGSPLFRFVDVGGERWVVVPVVMCKPGVRNGELVTEYELGIYEGADWNGTPILFQHPRDENGTPISANIPELMPYVIGRVFNARMENGGIVGEAWLRRDGVAINSFISALNEGREYDVSIGFFAMSDGRAGDIDGEQYSGKLYNIHPDHLAILTSERGACSWDDGCGIPRVNNQSEVNDMKGTVKAHEEDAGVHTVDGAVDETAAAVDDGAVDETAAAVDDGAVDETAAAVVDGAVDETDEQEIGEFSANDPVVAMSDIEAAVNRVVGDIVDWYAKNKPILDKVLADVQAEQDAMINRAHQVTGLPKCELKKLSFDALMQLVNKQAGVNYAAFGRAEKQASGFDNKPKPIF